MGTIVCQQCDCIIEHFESHKADTLYGVCENCCSHEQKRVLVEG
ncbi:GapA-binding peptide SR1P [Microaerobacter geothermalis]|nr:GapA-binding peptide SR1P [Microaerobacter geothermalis]MCF6093541.1 GapA-binding peptide SR1P [Microaerobacter geothermalis]